MEKEQNTKGYVYDFKGQSPIRMEFYQEELEKIQYFLGEAIKISAYYDKEHKNYQDNALTRNLSNIKDDVEWKIQQHKDRGEWF